MRKLRRLRCRIIGHQWRNRWYEDGWGCWVYECPRCVRVQMRWFD